MKDKGNNETTQAKIPAYITRKRKMTGRVARGWMALAKNN